MLPKTLSWRYLLAKMSPFAYFMTLPYNAPPPLEAKLEEDTLHIKVLFLSCLPTRGKTIEINTDHTFSLPTAAPSAPSLVWRRTKRIFGDFAAIAHCF